VTWEGRRVFVTGATGFVGAPLCAALVQAGASVSALLRPGRPVRPDRAHFLDGVTLCEGALDDVERVSALSRNADAIVHLAADITDNPRDTSPVPFYETNIRGTYHVVEAARRHRTPHVVVASTAKVYGIRQTCLLREDDALLAEGPYDVSKACAERLALDAAAFYGLSLGVARLAHVYGPGDDNWRRIVPGTIKSVLEGKRPILRSAQAVRDYLHVDDAVAACLLVAERVAEPTIAARAFNFSDGSPRTIGDAVRTIAAVAGRPELEPIVDGAGEPSHLALDTTRSRDVLGFSARYDFAAGLAASLPWYRSALPVAA
jgi:CDP-glucose 4,6-dehydratase